MRLLLSVLVPSYGLGTRKRADYDEYSEYEDFNELSEEFTEDEVICEF
jgi:hypothetical protein